MANSNVVSNQMTTNSRAQFDKCFLQLETLGLLLVSDSFFPNVYQLIAGDDRKGSWWGSDQAHTIFAVNEMLEDDPDVMVMKLISGKVTFVHRELWDKIYSIGIAREEWQLRKLSLAAKELLNTLVDEGTLTTNKLGKAFGPKPGEAVKQLELRLLVHADQIHTDSGAHAKVLEAWPVWAKRVGLSVRTKDPAAARGFLEQRVARINQDHNGSGTLPWPATTR